MPHLDDISDLYREIFAELADVSMPRPLAPRDTLPTWTTRSTPVPTSARACATPKVS
ncbi:MAG TPA: hypothetical protein VF482_13640 [Trebonia sp.]